MAVEPNEDAETATSLRSSVYLPDWMERELTEIARRTYSSRSAVIRRLLAEGLDRDRHEQAARTTGNPTRERQASAPAAASVARSEPLPVGRLPEGYVPVFGDLAANNAARPAVRRSGSATRNRKPA